MNTMYKKIDNNLKEEKQKGFVVLYAVLITSLVLAMVISITNISYKEIVLSSYARESHFAFFAADTGLECAMYQDSQEVFIGIDSNIDCPDDAQSVVLSFNNSLYPIYSFEFNLEVDNNKKYCSKVVVTKDYEADLDGDGSNESGLTKIESKGYNLPCGSINNSKHTVERALRVIY